MFLMIGWFTSQTARWLPRSSMRYSREYAGFCSRARFVVESIEPAGDALPKSVLLAPGAKVKRSVLYVSMGVIVWKKSRPMIAPPSPRDRGLPENAWIEPSLPATFVALTSKNSPELPLSKRRFGRAAALSVPSAMKRSRSPSLSTSTRSTSVEDVPGTVVSGGSRQVSSTKEKF